MVKEFIEKREAKSIALLGNAAEVHWQILERGIIPDVVTDQTSAHDVLYGYIPLGLSLEEAERTSQNQTKPNTKNERWIRWRRTSKQCSNSNESGAIVFDYGNNLRQRAIDNGVENAFDYPGFVPAYIRPLFCEGKGPFRWVALSGEKEDIYKTDEAIMNLFPENDHLTRWLTMAQEQVEFQGLPARICWLGYGERAKAGLKLNEMVASRRTQSPDRHRTRPSRLRLRRQPEPRNRSDERRLRRNRRLGLSQRNDKRRRRCNVGFTPPRRRSRHRLFTPRRTSHRRRRHTRSRQTNRKSSNHRPRNGRRPPR